MSLRSTRRQLYRGARILGDAQAVKVGRYPQRVGRKAVHRLFGRTAQRLSRALGL